MQVSFVIITFNRYNQLLRLLDSLYRVNLQSFIDQYEIIIVDDGSTDMTRGYIPPNKNTTIYHIKNSGPCRARNYGAKKANGEYIAFLDDDCVIPSEMNYIIALSGHINNKSLDVIGGPAYSISTSSIISKYLDRIGFLHLPCYDSKGYFACFPTVNLLIKKTKYSALNGFNEQFVRPGGEDNNFTIRAGRKGFKLYFDPLMDVYHDNSISFSKFIRRYFNYGRGNALNQKLLNLDNADCCFTIDTIKDIMKFIVKIKKSCMKFRSNNNIVQMQIFATFEIIRLICYELGGLYEKYKYKRMYKHELFSNNNYPTF